MQLISTSDSPGSPATADGLFRAGPPFGKYVFGKRNSLPFVIVELCEKDGELKDAVHRAGRLPSMVSFDAIHDHLGVHFQWWEFFSPRRIYRRASGAPLSGDVDEARCE